MSNFSVFPSEWFVLIQPAVKAEENVYDDSVVTALYCRKSIENWVDWVYENEASLEVPYDTGLNSLMNFPDFVKLIDPVVLKQMHLIRKLGNNAVHSKKRVPITSDEALHILKLLYGCTGYFVNLYSKEYEVYPTFDKDKIPAAQKVKENISKTQIRELTEQIKELRQLQKENEEKQKQAEENRKRHKEIVLPPTDPNEALTRKIYIDTYLEEAGWMMDNPRMVGLEYEVSPMPNPANKGFADYVLWGRDGKPLAVVEAKKTTVGTDIGEHQAKLYADALEKEFNQRPNIYLTNGYEIYYSDHQTPKRKVFGFHTQNELQLNIDRRINLRKITEMEISDDITNRYYQKAAIKAVAERFEAGYRGALLVMATGTGKTRTAASLIDVMAKALWVKNALFLADRTALVDQAKANLNIHLSEFPSINLLEEKENPNSRLVFSTYQTLINLIDDAKAEEGRFYGVGHFDLIIFDEIHRSIYNKYRAIFEYFDGLKIGLTATPREEQIDRNTYELFGLQGGNPTYSYNFRKAVDDGYLVDYKSYDVKTKFRREGIKYNDLSEEERLEFEEKFGDPVTGEIPDEIDASQLDEWIFNKNTVDLILEELMEKGIRVDNDTRLGKTIIFTRKHDHAVFIQERFNANYPEYRGEFLKVIDYQTNYSKAILGDFKAKDKNPVIACSVDMLDTGIDIPEVVNLIFLKPVKSHIKFWQMIGRGARLCPNLHGAREDKKEFLILDFCENFEYFSENPHQKEGSKVMTLNQKLFILKLRLSQIFLIDSEEEIKTYGKEILDQLHSQVLTLYTEGKDSFVVRRNLRSVEQFSNRANWDELTIDELRVLESDISELVYDDDKDSKAKMFDLLIYDLMLSVVNGNNRQVNLKGKVKKSCRSLKKKQNIPMVKEKMPVLEMVTGEKSWEDVDVLWLDNIREELRDLMKFLDNQARDIVVTDFQDEIISVEEAKPIVEKETFDLEAYERKIKQYILEHKNHIVIDKLRKNIKITKPELNALEEMLFEQSHLGGKEKFKEVFGEQSLGLFIRSIVGLDATTAKDAFSKLINDAGLNAKQIEFLNMIIENYIQNGIVTPGDLFDDPYTTIDTGGVIHLFGKEKSKEIEEIIEQINSNSEFG